MSLHLHGVVRSGHRLPDGSPFRLVELEDVAVVVSERTERRPLTEQEATAHLAGLCAMVPDGPVLPLRIGTTAVDEAAARAAVHALAVPVLRGHLDRLDGMAEMHVRLKFEEDAALQAVFDEGAFTGGGGDFGSTITQGELVARRIVAWCGKRADGLLAQVAATAEATVPLNAREPTEVLRAFLVPLNQLDVVRTVVAALDGVTATCTGPLPAFHFLDLAPAASRWGW